MIIEIEIPDDKIRSVLSGAHIRYWATDIVWEPKHIQLTFREPDEVTQTNVARVLHDVDFRRGLAVMARVCPEQFGNLLSRTHWDATTGDCLIQCAAFGELKYG